MPSWFYPSSLFRWYPWRWFYTHINVFPVLVQYCFNWPLTSLRLSNYNLHLYIPRPRPLLNVILGSLFFSPAAMRIPLKLCSYVLQPELDFWLLTCVNWRLACLILDIVCHLSAIWCFAEWHRMISTLIWSRGRWSCSSASFTSTNTNDA